MLSPLSDKFGWNWLSSQSWRDDLVERGKELWVSMLVQCVVNDAIIYIIWGNWVKVPGLYCLCGDTAVTSGRFEDSFEEVGQVFLVGSAEKLERLSSYKIIKLFFRNLSSSRRTLIMLRICEQYWLFFAVKMGQDFLVGGSRAYVGMISE